MQKMLADNGIKCRVKFINKGSMRGTFRLYDPKTTWYGNAELQQKIISLGFQPSCPAYPIGDFSGNGGAFSVFLRHPMKK